MLHYPVRNNTDTSTISETKPSEGQCLYIWMSPDQLMSFENFADMVGSTSSDAVISWHAVQIRPTVGRSLDLCISVLFFETEFVWSDCLVRGRGRSGQEQC